MFDTVTQKVKSVPKPKSQASQGEKKNLEEEKDEIRKARNLRPKLGSKILKKKHKGLLTIIIPRHTQRTPEIINALNDLGLKIHCHSSKENIKLFPLSLNSFNSCNSFFCNFISLIVKYFIINIFRFLKII